MTIATAPAEIARQEIDTFTERVAAIRLSLHKVIVGQEERLICCWCARSRARTRCSSACRAWLKR